MIRRILLVVLLTLFLFPGFCMAQESPKKIKTAYDAMLLSYANRNALIPWEKVIRNCFPEYRQAPDEFTRHGLLKKIKSKIKKDIQKFKSIKTICVETSKTLPEYDFKKNGFPLSISSPMLFKSKYGIFWDNYKEFSFIPVTMETGRKIVSLISGRRTIKLLIFAKVIEANKKYNNMTDCHVTKIRVIAEGGNKSLSLEFPPGETSLKIRELTSGEKAARIKEKKKKNSRRKFFPSYGGL